MHVRRRFPLLGKSIRCPIQAIHSEPTPIAIPPGEMRPTTCQYRPGPTGASVTNPVTAAEDTTNRDPNETEFPRAVGRRAVSAELVLLLMRLWRRRRFDAVNRPDISVRDALRAYQDYGADAVRFIPAHIMRDRLKKAGLVDLGVF